MDAAAGVDRSGWSGAARSAELVELLGARERLDTAILAAAGVWDAEQAWAQRRAAALIHLATGDTPPPVTIDVILDADTLAGRPPSDLLDQCCELAGSGPISPALARTLTCDAAIGRIVMNGKSEVIDLGRRTRLVTPAQRRALDIRDTGCVEPGCTAPAHWCDAHHIIHWTHHGPTELTNLELRCRRHHLLQHQRDLDTTLRRQE